MAAKQAVVSTGLSRVVLALPLLGPSIILIAIEKARLMPRHLFLRKGLEFSLLFIELIIALPLALAAFEQRAKIPTDKVEEHIKAELSKDVRFLYYNKGL